MPSDGEFPVMNYRITQEFKPPFRINSLIEEAGPLKVDHAYCSVSMYFWNLKNFCENLCFGLNRENAYIYLNSSKFCHTIFVFLYPNVSSNHIGFIIKK